jgi:hypothetical protein
MTSAADNCPVPQPDATLQLFDFSQPAIVKDWAPIDDRVMGGISATVASHPCDLLSPRISMTQATGRISRQLPRT